MYSRALRNLDRMRRNAPPLSIVRGISSSALQRKYELAVVEHFWCATYVDALRPYCRRLVLDLHNIESILLRAMRRDRIPMGRFALRRFSSACHRLESELLPRFDILLVTSEADRARINGRSGLAEYYAVRAAPSSAPRRTRSHSPATWHITRIRPRRISSQSPSGRFFEAGTGTRLEAGGKESARAGIPQDPRILVTGAVADALPLLAGAKAAVVPLLSGQRHAIQDP